MKDIVTITREVDIVKTIQTHKGSADNKEWIYSEEFSKELAKGLTVIDTSTWTITFVKEDPRTGIKTSYEMKFGYDDNNTVHAFKVPVSYGQLGVFYSTITFKVG